MRYLTLILLVLLTGCADKISGTQSVVEITKTTQGSTCEFTMTVNNDRTWFSCPCPDTVRVGDQVVLQFVRP